jgi:general secretion pathway protein A
MSYCSYWQLKEKPFEELCDTRFFFESEDHREALDRLLYVVNDRNMNMGLLTGEVGSGKTITKNVLISSLPPQNFEVIDFDNSSFEFTDILYDIVKRITFRDNRLDLLESELPDRSDKYMLTQVFKKKLETLLYEEKRHLVIIFDEAQQIADKVLDEIKNLTNISSRVENFMTIFLVGQPELREKVRLLKQVDQRIFLRFHLNNLDFNGSTKYIQHRLRVAGLEKGTIFTSLGYEILFRSTGGIPREINRLCKLALNYGFAQELKEISREDIQVIIDDLQEHSQ